MSAETVKNWMQKADNDLKIGGDLSSLGEIGVVNLGKGW